MKSNNFPKMKNDNSLDQNKRKSFTDVVPREVENVQKQLEMKAPKDRKEYILTEEFIKLCKNNNVYVIVGCTKTHSIRIMSPDGDVKTVYFFDSQSKNVLKHPENVMMTDKNNFLTTEHKRSKPLSIKQIDDNVINKIVADIYVGIRKVIFNTKKIGTRDIMGVWIKDYPYVNVSIGDYNNKQKDDILLFSSKKLKRYPQTEIERYKIMKEDNENVFRE